MDDHFEVYDRVSLSGKRDDRSREAASVYSCFHKSNAPDWPPRVLLNAGMGSCSISMGFNPTNARRLAEALMKAADVVQPLFDQWKKDCDMPITLIEPEEDNHVF